MGIRETVNQNPAITTGVTIGIIVIALGIIMYQLFGNSGYRVVTENYYTIDDGQSYFTDEANKVAPFDKDGKQAVRCYVFKCSDGKPFVAYLERMNEKFKDKYAEALKAQQNPDNAGQAGMEAEEFRMQGQEVKKPGDEKWVNQQSPEAEKITQITCPDGDLSKLEIVLP